MLLKVLVICSVFAPSLSLIKDHSDDFYWRDYNGEVPKDALPGGMDRDHKVTYIGQAVSSGTLVPGEIIGGIKKMYYPGDYSARVETENIKILCTKHPENFEWIKTNANDVKMLSKMRLIPGGFSNSEEVYIGKGIAENVLAVGKVTIPNGSRSAQMKVAVSGENHAITEFDILSYRLQDSSYYDDGSNTTSYGSVFLSIVTLVLHLII